MPTYDYKCDACEHTFEEFQSMKDELLKKCPRCKKKKLRRLIGTGAAILFKGSGFYQTDYRSESYKSAAKEAETASTPAPASGAGSSETAKTPTASASGGDTKASEKTPAKKAKS